jgi:hypothetical protein
VARCPECGSSYCRECIAEHDERVICASCLQRLLKRPAEKTRSWGKQMLWLAGSVCGIFLAWLSFYNLGRVLLMVPSSFHSELWGESEEMRTELPRGGR